MFSAVFVPICALNLYSKVGMKQVPPEPVALFGLGANLSRPSSIVCKSERIVASWPYEHEPRKAQVFNLGTGRGDYEGSGGGS